MCNAGLSIITILNHFDFESIVSLKLLCEYLYFIGSTNKGGSYLHYDTLSMITLTFVVHLTKH